VRAGRCEACHDPHGGEPHLLRQPPQALCLSCHRQGGAAWRKDSHVHSPEPKGECAGCHDPHASDRPRLLAVAPEQRCVACHGKPAAMRPGVKLHVAFTGGDCTTCHEPHAGGKATLRGDGADVCLACHVGVRKTWAPC
jgi:predicted CXXCH cytochrome family protein